MKSFFAKYKSNLFLFAIVIALWFILPLFFDNFGGAAQLSYILLQSSFLGIAAAGQNIIMLTGGIDLSCGNAISLSGVLFSYFLTRLGIPFVLSLALTLLCVMAFGFLNGYCISTFRIPPMVMTLSMATMIMGVELLITNGFPASIDHAAFKNWVTHESFLGIANSTLAWVVVAAFMVFFLRRTVTGRKIYLYGSNPVATKYSGFRDRQICLITYTAGAAMFAISGLLLVGYTGQSALNIGDDYQYLSIAAVVLGGTSVNGGKGGYVGTIAGVLILIIVQSILVMLNIDYGGQNFVEGLIILALTTVYASSVREKRKSKMHNKLRKEGMAQ